MPKFVIERDILAAGKLSVPELQHLAEKSCGVLRGLGPDIQWLESYVTDDRVYCIYIAPSIELIRAHAARSGFPADRISQVRTVIDPTLADAVA